MIHTNTRPPKSSLIGSMPDDHPHQLITTPLKPIRHPRSRSVSDHGLVINCVSRMAPKIDWLRPVDGLGGISLEGSVKL